MKTRIIFFAFLLSTTFAFGQASNDTIVVAPGVSGMYFFHVVEKGESVQTLSKTYGIPEKQLLQLNRLNSSQPLKSYELIKIPIQKNQIIQKKISNSTSQNLTPLYHKVLKGETLYRVGKMYGDIPLTSIRDWNHLDGNAIKTGQYLIIGWLRKNANPTASASQKTKPQSTTKTEITETESPEENRTPKISRATEQNPPEKRKNQPTINTHEDPFLKEVIASERNKAGKNQLHPVKREPVAKPLLADVSTKTTGPAPSDISKEDPPVSKPLLQDKTPAQTGVSTAKKENPFEKILNKVTQKPPQKTVQKPIPTPPDKTAPTPKKPLEETGRQTSTASAKETPKTFPPLPESNPDAAPPAPKEEETKVVAAPPENPVATAPEEVPDSGNLTLAQISEFQELYFAQTQNEKIISSKKGAAGWFKSNVKPGSKKYYALCNDLPRGTIVKVINPINNRYVFVKVLASIPQQKENYNLIIKLSNAAMEDLGTSQPRFWSEIVYPKVK